MQPLGVGSGTTLHFGKALHVGANAWRTRTMAKLRLVEAAGAVLAVGGKRKFAAAAL